MRAIHAFVSGNVQGVFFRQSCRRVARELGVLGWVRNTRDGRVEVWGQGEDEAMAKFNDWLWAGPSSSAVSGVLSTDAEIDGTLQDFLIIS